MRSEAAAAGAGLIVRRCFEDGRLGGDNQAWAALVEVELYAAVQERLEENRWRQRQRRCGPRFLLQGLVVCGCCGYAFIGVGKGAEGQRAYYRCHGTNACRFGGQAVCGNRMQRVEDLDAAVWKDVQDLLSEPARLGQEFARRRQQTANGQATLAEESLHQVQQSMSRLLDAYTDGYVERRDFTQRMARLQERGGKLQTDLQRMREQAQRDKELQVVCSRVQDFADQVKAGLTTADCFSETSGSRQRYHQHCLQSALPPFCEGPHTTLLASSSRGHGTRCSLSSANVIQAAHRLVEVLQEVGRPRITSRRR